MARRAPGRGRQGQRPDAGAGNSRKEIMRMLQRYIARELYPLIIDALRPALPGD